MNREKAMYDRSDFIVQELFRFLRKAQHLTPEEELSTCSHIAVSEPEIGRLWFELIRQVHHGIHH